MSRATTKLGLWDNLYAGTVALLGAALVRALGSTWRLVEVGGDLVEEEHVAGRRVVFAFWHRDIMAMAYAKRGTGTHVLISWHRDGEIIARLVRRLGIGVVRGSTSRGSARGLADMVHKGSHGHDLAITPDGPRGPACVMQPGVVHLSVSAHASVVPVGVAASPVRRLSSWDRFVIPLPLARMRIVYGDPIRFEAGADTEAARALLEERMASLAARAESLLGGGSGASRRSQ